MKHRSFIALFPPVHVVKQLVKIQSGLKELVNNVRWEKEEKFHFTLQFFGE
jgi:2'-5' RNA ligase